MNRQRSALSGFVKRPELTREEQALQKEWKIYDDMIQQIKQAKCYIDKGGPEELEELITKWRTIAQSVAQELLGVFIEQKELFMMETSWDYWGDEESISMEHTRLDEPDEPEEEQEQQQEQDPMVHMLTSLRIDPEVIHYSAEINSFYE
ncbi:hypothetical protein K492DRAFT_204788 [Lichtheimia hyalospora FSU 10163]|nr:hypothetical protein K492DRAFT_204788 [Lichtheimia hyalospora FSU 10163]